MTSKWHNSLLGAERGMVIITNPKVHMGTITGGEARELYAANPVILLPMGSHEDQGPHAPMGDYLLAEKIAELAAAARDRAGHAHSGGAGAAVRRRRFLRARCPAASRSRQATLTRSSPTWWRRCIATA